MNRILILACLAVVAGGCSSPNVYQPPPPPKVVVASPVIRTVTDYLEETGTTAAMERVEIRARVSGFLQQIEFEEGKLVEAGQTLYRIQPEEYEAKLAAAEAELAANQAALDLAAADLRREEELRKREASTEADIDLARAKRDAARAALDAAVAARDQAQLDLNYTNVTTPIAGRVERTLVKQGNLVGGSDATHLTTVVQYDPIHVYFSISERALLMAMADTEPEDGTQRDLSSIPAELRRSTDADYQFEGHLDYADLGVDESTGTFLIRATFPNPDRRLFPGLFVRIRVPLGTTENAVLIPERAVGADQVGRFVLITGPENVVERREVSLGARQGELVIVREGLTGDERVIVDGLLKARPGSEVEPVPAAAMSADASEADSAEEASRGASPGDAAAETADDELRPD